MAQHCRHGWRMIPASVTCRASCKRTRRPPPARLPRTSISLSLTPTASLTRWPALQTLNMQIILNLTPEQEAALKYIANKAGTPERLDAEGNVIPAVVVDPETYFRARIDGMLASYGEQMRAEDMEAIAIAYKAAAEADKDAVFAALKAERPTTK